MSIEELIKQRDMLREALILLYDEAHYSGNIYEYGDYGQRMNPYLELPKKIDDKIKEILDLTKPPED